MQPDPDEGAVRAKDSACTGYSLADSVFVWLAKPDSVLGQYRACAAKTTDCDEVLRCQGLEPKTACVPGGKCDGSVARRCEALPTGRNVEYTEDCANDPSGNTTCVDPIAGDPGDLPTCSSGSCDQDKPKPCEGNTSFNCSDGLEWRSDCAAQGRTCSKYPNNNETTCVGKQPCDADVCDGAEIVTCNAGFEYDRVDCTLRVPNGTCELVNKTPKCVAAAPSADCPTGSPDKSWCVGDVGVACVAGARVATDCAAFEGARCVEDKANGFAICQLP